MDETKRILGELVANWNPALALERIEAMTPDASLRRYYRIYFSKGEPKTIVAMVFDSVACPEAGGGAQVDSDVAYVELSDFFGQAAVLVPKLLFDAREKAVLLIEDLGDRQLSSLLGESAEQPSDEIEKFFSLAVDQILAIQKIPKQEGVFPFDRYFNAELYCKEMSEFEDYILKERGWEPERISQVSELFSKLAAELEALPQVLVHRDFHAWNLIIDRQNRIRVIDFQDALLATRCYDLVSLLNDRDMDNMLGEKTYCRLVSHFVRAGGFGDEIYEEYDRALLQRDLKVAGRFAKLNKERGLVGYTKWIPGTMRRIGQTLGRMARGEGTASPWSEMLKELSDLDEIRQGSTVHLELRQ